jgi:transcriptional regulator with XRE-family HTH domain
VEFVFPQFDNGCKKGENSLKKEDFAKFLGEHLKRGRYELGITQEELAWKINMSDEGYSKIERGKSIPNALTLYTIHIKTGISIDHIFKEFDKIDSEKEPGEE